MRALARTLLMVLCFALPAAAQLDPGNYDIRQHGRTVGEIYVPDRAEGATTYVEHWVLFRGYVYPSSRRDSAIRIRRSQQADDSEEEFFRRVPWDTGFRYVRIDATDTDELPHR